MQLTYSIKRILYILSLRCIKFHGLERVVIKVSKIALGFTCSLGEACSTATPVSDKIEDHQCNESVLRVKDIDTPYID